MCMVGGGLKSVLIVVVATGRHVPSVRCSVVQPLSSGRMVVWSVDQMPRLLSDGVVVNRCGDMGGFPEEKAFMAV